MSCRRARTFDPATGSWCRKRPESEVYSPEWIVDTTLTPRPANQDSTFCKRLTAEEVEQSQLDQLRMPLLRQVDEHPPRLSLSKLVTTSGFIYECGWDVAGMRADDAAVRDFVVKYLGTVLDEVAALREAPAADGRSKSDAVRPKVATALLQDVEWLERAAVKRYLSEHHCSAQKETQHLSL